MDTKKLRQKILDLAIRGKLVPQDPNDEPASVLLQRIRDEKERLIKEGKIKRSKKTATDEEIEAPFEIPESWEWTRLDGLCDIKGGKRIPRGMDFSKFPTKHVYLRVTNMKSHTIIENEIKYIDEDVFNIIKNYTISSDDLYLTIAGTIGDVGEIPLKFSGMNLTENAAKLTNLQCDKHYLMYALLSSSAQEHFSSKFHQVAQPKLSIETASSAMIAMPPLAEQQRIVNEVERWFAVIDTMESNEGDLLKAIDQAKSKILDLAIHGKLVPQDPNDEPASVLLAKIRKEKEQLVKAGKLKKKDLIETPITEDEIPFDIPESWEWCRLKSFVQFINGDRGKNYPSKDKLVENGEIPFISAINIEGNSISPNGLLYVSQKQYDALSQGKLHNNDVVLCIRGSLGKAAIYPFEKGAIASSLVILRNIGETYNKYLIYYLNTPLFFSQINSNDNGTAQPNLSADNVANFYVPLPPYKEQLRIVAKIEELFGILDGIKESLEA